MPEPLTAEEIAVIRTDNARHLQERQHGCRSCVMRISRLLDTHDALAREVETLQQERDDARLLVCEVALGVTHYTGPGGCGDPSPCVRCRAEAAEARLREAADTCPVCASVRDHRVDCGCDRCDRRVLVEERRALVAALREAERERDEARALVADAAARVAAVTETAITAMEQADAVLVEINPGNYDDVDVGRQNDSVIEASRLLREAIAALRGGPPAPAPAACPERDECLRLRGQPIGMYHCTHCGTMVLAGVDPTPLCPWVSGGGTEAHETPTRPALTADVRTQAEGLCPVCDHRADWHVETGCLAETDITLRRCGCLAVTDSTPPRPALTAEQREALRQKAEAATPGGWVAVEAPQGWWTVESSSEERVRLLSRIAELENVVFHVKQGLLDSKARVEQEVHYLTEVYNRKV